MRSFLGVPRKTLDRKDRVLEVDSYFVAKTIGAVDLLHYLFDYIRHAFIGASISLCGLEKNVQTAGSGRYFSLSVELAVLIN